MFLYYLVSPTIVIIHGRGRSGTIRPQEKEKEIVCPWQPGRLLVERPIVAGKNARVCNEVIWPVLVGVDGPLAGLVRGEGAIMGEFAKPFLVECISCHVG